MSLTSKRLQIKPKNSQFGPNRSAEAIAENNDLLTEILIRLPVKSLLRFKAVSKGWYFLISDPNLSHHLRSLDSVAGIFLCCNREFEFVPLTEKPFEAPFKSLTFDDNPSGLQILQSCNGLLCCSCNYNYRKKPDYYIYNPTTKQYFKLPQLPIQDTIIVHGVGLAFDPTKSPYYEVVFVRQSDHIKADFSEPVELDDEYISYQVEIYSSKTRSWCTSGDPFVLPRAGSNFKGGFGMMES